MKSAAGGLKQSILCLVSASLPILGLLGGGSGCSSFEHHRYIFWGEIVPQHPETLEDHWTDYGPFLPNDRSMKMRRGKAGVIRFYSKKDYECSIPVDGELVVYVFDGNDGGVELTEPKYKLAIDSERLNRQRKFDKKNGYSYHIWLDLGEVDQPAEAISILTVFTEAKTNDQVASGVTYTQIGGEPIKEIKSQADLKKSLAESASDSEFSTIPSFGELEKRPASHEPSEMNVSGSNQILSVNLSESMAEHIAAAPPATNPEKDDRRPPIKTAYNPIETPDEPTSFGPPKLTFDQLRSIKSPTYGSAGHFNRGVVNSQGVPELTESAPDSSPNMIPDSASPNLLDPRQTTGAKVIYQ